MVAKIKFSFLRVLFRLFSFLADKTGGWKMFVKPKLLLGTLLVGITVGTSVTSCATSCYDVPANDPYVTDTTQVVTDTVPETPTEFPNINKLK
ncbi:MAG: hypothetical protein LBT04_03840 [Prevotellaceae bacterium]|jgi:hypothetical protein|nr:hypothetical protein [Prevotellaceae bacterium]